MSRKVENWTPDPKVGGSNPLRHALLFPLLSRENQQLTRASARNPSSIIFRRFEHKSRKKVETLFRRSKRLGKARTLRPELFLDTAGRAKPGRRDMDVTPPVSREGPLHLPTDPLHASDQAPERGGPPSGSLAGSHRKAWPGSVWMPSRKPLEWAALWAPAGLHGPQGGMGRPPGSRADAAI
jgi:hypothetical protein